MPTSKLTRVRVEFFSKIIASDLPVERLRFALATRSLAALSFRQNGGDVVTCEITPIEKMPHAVLHERR